LAATTSPVAGLTQVDPLPPVFAQQPNPSLAPTLGPLPVTARVRHRHGLPTPTTSGNVTLYQWHGPIDLSFGTYQFDQMLGFEQLIPPNDHRDIFAVPGDSGTMVVVDSGAQSFGGMGVGLLTARSFIFDPSGNHFQGYVFLMCALDSVAEDLANEMNLKKSDLKFFKDF
jgi:hypothetical protein